MTSAAARVPEITGVILAGGRGLRLGGVDKGLVTLRGRRLVEYAIERLRPQVTQLVISANRHRATYAGYGFPVVADAYADYPGPLAGLLSGLRAATTPYVVSVPCDTPVFPHDLVARLDAARRAAGTRACVVRSATKMQPVFALLETVLADALQAYLESGGRAVGAWLRRLDAVPVDFPDTGNAFRNINTARDLQAMESEGGLKIR